MANEVQLRIQFSFSKAGVRDGVESAGTFNLASSIYQRGRQTVGLTTEPMEMGDVATGGFIYIENLDSTNFVEIRTAGSTDADFLIRLLPGQFTIFPTLTGAIPLQLRADTAPVDVEYLALSA